MSLVMGSEDDFKLGKNLKRLMEARRLTVTQAAKKVRMNKSTLHNYCNGQMPRHLGKLKQLADLFGISLDELLFGEKDPRVSIQTEGDIEGRFEVTIKRMK